MRTGYYPPKVEVKDYNVMIDEKKNFLIEKLKGNENIYNIQKIAPDKEMIKQLVVW